MKRDMELIREQLLALESGADPLAIVGHSKEALLYHLYLLDDAGFIHSTIARGSQGEIIAVHVFEITWDGQEFISAIRDASIFRNALSAVAKTAGAVTVTVLKDYLTMKAKEKLGLPV